MSMRLHCYKRNNTWPRGLLRLTCIASTGLQGSALRKSATPQGTPFMRSLICTLSRSSVQGRGPYARTGSTHMQHTESIGTRLPHNAPFPVDATTLTTSTPHSAISRDSRRVRRHTANRHGHWRAEPEGIVSACLRSPAGRALRAMCAPFLLASARASRWAAGAPLLGLPRPSRSAAARGRSCDVTRTWPASASGVGCGCKVEATRQHNKPWIRTASAPDSAVSTAT
eukprot:353516-Chlamydomonas_euryale.AAC.6